MTFSIPKTAVFVFACIMLACGCTAKAKAERNLQRGDAYFDGKEWEKAKIEYLNAYRRGIRDAHVVSRLAECFMQEGDFGNAAGLLVQARTLQPTNLTVRAKLGAFYLVARKPKEAREEAEAILKIDPANRDGILLLTDSVTTTNEIALLKPRLEKLQPAYPTNAAIPFALGILSHKTRELDQAISYYQKSLTLDSNQSRIHVALAEIAAARKDTNTADAQYQAAAALAPAKSFERLRQAENLLKTQRREEAEKLLIETIEKEPDFVVAINMLVESLLSRNKLDDAQSYNNKALAASPTNRDALLIRARIKLMLRDVSGAITDLQDLSKNFPRDAGIQYQLALAHLANNDQAKALTALDTAISLDPKNVQAILARSELQIRNRNPDAAIPDLTRIATEFPRVTQGRFLLASAHYSKKELDKALELYSGLAADLPNDPRPFYLKGICYRDQKKGAEARTAFESSLKVSPGYLPTIEELLNLDLRENKASAAMARVNSYLEKYTNQPALFLLKARVLAADKKSDEAIAALEQALKIEPNFAIAQRAIVDIYLASGKQDEAIAKLSSMVKANPKDLNSLLQLAMLQEAKKDYKAARTSYESIVAAKPDTAVALNNLANLAIEQFGDIDAGLDYAKKARDLAPADPSVGDTYGWALWKKGDYARALTLLEETTEKLSNLPEAVYHLGMAHYMTGAEGAALKTLEAAANATNDFNGKDRARQALVILKIQPASADATTLQLLEKTVAQSPKDLFAHIRLAQISEQQKNWTRANQSYQTALSISPRSQFVLARLAELNCDQLGNKPRALELAKDAWNIAPAADLAASLGRVGYLAGDFKWANGVLTDARRAKPNDAVVAFYLALSAYGAGDLSQATDTLQDVATAPQGHPLAKAALTLLHYQSDTSRADPTAAVTTSLATDPGFPPALIVAGIVAEQKKNYTEARPKYEQVLKAYPNHVFAQRQLGLLLANQLAGDGPAAPLLASAKVALPGDATLTKALGKIAYRRADYKEAARLLRDAVLSLPDDADTLYHLGLSQHQLNEKQAKDSLNRALKLDANSALAADAKKILAELK